MSDNYRGVDPDRLSGEARHVFESWARLYQRQGLSESAASRQAIDSVVDSGLLAESDFSAHAHPARRLGLSEAAARIVEAGAPPSSALLDTRPPAARVGRTDADWSRVREAARRCGARPRSRGEHLSDDERRFAEAVAARERRGLSFTEAIAAAEAAIREGDTR